MSSYFDKFDHEVADLCEQCGQDTEAFLKGLLRLEERLKKDSLLFAGDVETPHEVRETIVATVALNEVRYEGGDFLGDKLGPSKGAQYAAACRRSKLSAELHSLWHDIASMRYVMRYGPVNDNPEWAVKRRDDNAVDPKRRKSQWTFKEPFKSRLLDEYRRRKPDFAVL